MGESVKIHREIVRYAARMGASVTVEHDGYAHFVWLSMPDGFVVCFESGCDLGTTLVYIRDQRKAHKLRARAGR